MILSKQEEFSDAQAVTVTAIGTNVKDTKLVAFPFMVSEYDLVAATNSAAQTDSTRDLGAGQPMWVVVQVDTAATAGGAATVTVTFESSAAAAMTTPTVHFTSPAFSIAQMTPSGTVSNTLLAFMAPLGSYLQFLGIRYTVATGPLTAGNFSAFMTRDVQSYRSYPAPYVVG
jgi:hypothetical protein